MFVFRGPEWAAANEERQLEAQEERRRQYRDGLKAQISAHVSHAAAARQAKERDLERVEKDGQAFREEEARRKGLVLSRALQTKTELDCQLMARKRRAQEQREAEEREAREWAAKFERERLEAAAKSQADKDRKGRMAAQQMEAVQEQMRERERRKAKEHQEMLRLAQAMHAEQERKDRARREDLQLKMELNKKRLDNADRGWAGAVREKERAVQAAIESAAEKQLREKEVEEKRRADRQRVNVLKAREWCRQRLEQKGEERKQELKELQQWRDKVERDARGWHNAEQAKGRDRYRRQREYAAALATQVAERKTHEESRRLGAALPPAPAFARLDLMAQCTDSLAAMSPTTAGSPGAAFSGSSDVTLPDSAAPVPVSGPKVRNALSVAGQRTISSDKEATQLMQRARKDPRFFSM